MMSAKTTLIMIMEPFFQKEKMVRVDHIVWIDERHMMNSYAKSVDATYSISA